VSFRPTGMPRGMPNAWLPSFYAPDDWSVLILLLPPYHPPIVSSSLPPSFYSLSHSLAFSFSLNRSSLSTSPPLPLSISLPPSQPRSLNLHSTSLHLTNTYVSFITHTKPAETVKQQLWHKPYRQESGNSTCDPSLPDATPARTATVFSSPRPFEPVQKMYK